MHTKKIGFDVRLLELDLLEEILMVRITEWEGALRRSQQGEVSLIELIDCERESEAEYYLEMLKDLVARIQIGQRQADRNTLNFVDEQLLFRPDQKVEIFRLTTGGIDQTIYVLETRHHYYLVYQDLEELITAFTKNRESKLRFETYPEVMQFLHYWRPGIEQH